MSHNYSFVVVKYLFWNELTFLVTYDVIMNVSSEAAVSQMFFKGDVLKNFVIFTRKRLSWSLFRRPATLLKRDSNTGVFL